MQDRGLLVPDVARAERYVRSIGYYRLSPYMIPFRHRGSDDFRIGVAFDDLLDLYVFDRKLRLLVLDAVERVEVTVRSALTDLMAQAHGAFWYLDPIHFRDARRHRDFLRMVRDDCSQQLLAEPEQTDGTLVHQSALEHYLLTYACPELPPSWIVMERLTLGQVEHLIGNLKLRSDRTAIAKSLGITEPLLVSWMRTLCSRPEHLRPPWAAVECRLGRVTGAAHIADGGVAGRSGRGCRQSGASGAALPGPGGASVLVVDAFSG